MKKQHHYIKAILPGSIASEFDLQAGDEVLAVNNTEIEDVFDYHYLINDEYVELLVRKQDGDEWILEIQKEYDEDLGIEFQSGLMDTYKSCSNKCIFCFIDQLPKGMRETMYFKDDDSRLSFLQGNYITLTNMKEKDIERIIKYKLAPINISVHTTNPELRCKMLNNRFAGKVLEYIKKLYDHGILMNGQIVLCKGVNDKEELYKTIRDLSEFIPYMESVSVVPVGITKFRDGLYPMESFTPEDAQEVLGCVHQWQDQLYRDFGTHFIHASDEWYDLANAPIPEERRYDGYLQLENGVGMLRLLKEEFLQGLTASPIERKDASVSIATGQLAYPYICELIVEFTKKYPRIKVQVYPVRNDFFGEKITVSGLLTGQDLISQLKGKNLGEALLLPENVLRSGEQVFLDDVRVEALEKALQVKVRIVKSNGQDLIDQLLGVKYE